jgi:hypothetical protein
MITLHECDVCGKIAVLLPANCCSIETFACAECQGYPTGAFDYLLDEPEPGPGPGWVEIPGFGFRTKIEESK